MTLTIQLYDAAMLYLIGGMLMLRWTLSKGMIKHWVSGMEDGQRMRMMAGKPPTPRWLEVSACAVTGAAIIAAWLPLFAWHVITAIMKR